jgi:hypothetical protein
MSHVYKSQRWISPTSWEVCAINETAAWLKDVLGGDKRLKELRDKLQDSEKLSLFWFEKVGAIIEENGKEMDDLTRIRLNTILDEFGRLASTTGCLRSELDFILKKG